MEAQENALRQVKEVAVVHPIGPCFMMSLSMDTTNKLSITQVCENIQNMGQLVNDCIRASGGSLNLSKCSWHCSVPTRSKGKPDVREIAHEPQIFPTHESPAVTIPRLLKGTPHRQLGVQVIPSLSPKPQLALLQQKCHTFALQIRRNSLSPHQSSIVFKHYIALAIQFPCTTHAIPSNEIKSLQRIVLGPLLSKLGILLIPLQDTHFILPLSWVEQT
mmetsp:Transcript_19220/g.29702  ORF Transcript_19220/g.29702 Transcript_19220/m.29702 type:complete len:218 (-) Transcript_19220:903-1556(-)